MLPRPTLRLLRPSLQLATLLLVPIVTFTGLALALHRRLTARRRQAATESVKPTTKPTPERKRKSAATPPDAAAAPAEAVLGDAARRVMLGKLLVQQGHAAGNTAARALLTAGRVTVDGALERSFSRQIADGFDVRVHACATAAVAVAAAASCEGEGGSEGEDPASLAPHLVVWCKPCGVVCSLGDDFGGHTNLQSAITAPALRRPGLHPVGRLDCHSCGLMLWTTDGRLTRVLLEPRHALAREYACVVRGRVRCAATLRRRLRDGVDAPRFRAVYRAELLEARRT